MQTVLQASAIFAEATNRSAIALLIFSVFVNSKLISLLVVYLSGSL